MPNTGTDSVDAVDWTESSGSSEQFQCAAWGNTKFFATLGIVNEQVLTQKRLSIDNKSYSDSCEGYTRSFLGV